MDLFQFVLSFRPSTVVQYYMKYTGFVAWPQSPQARSWTSCSLSEVASRFMSEQKIWGIDVFFEEERSVKTMGNFFHLDLHYIMHTLYSSGSRTI